MSSGECLSVKGGMNFRLSIHVQNQLASRKLPLQLLQIVFENPQQIVEGDRV